jgi:hypothetical protein
LQRSLPKMIREIASKATESDTIMLFIAGHGLQDPSRLDHSGRQQLSETVITPIIHVKEIGGQVCLEWQEHATLVRASSSVA